MATHEGCKRVHDPSAAGSTNKLQATTNAIAGIAEVSCPKVASSNLSIREVRFAIAGIATTHDNQKCTHAAGALNQIKAKSTHLEPAVMAGSVQLITEASPGLCAQRAESPLANSAGAA